MSFARLWPRPGRDLLIGSLAFLVAWPLCAVPSPDQAILVAADTGFAFGLMKELAREQPARNVFISPCSISTVLQMVCNGAAGSTHDEMAGVLGTSGLETAALNQAYKDLDAAVRGAQAEVALSIANAIWYSVRVDLKPGFASLNKDFYGATLDALDFTDPGAGGIVNAWADRSTQGRIKNIVDGRFPDDVRMLLANAIYFKGTWERKFDPKATKERPFHLAGGAQRQTPMMEQGGQFEYQEGNGCQTVRLPYKGRRLGMYVLLPEAASSVEKLLANLNTGVWQDQLLRRMQSRPGRVVVPRFKLEYSAELKQPLQTMGMRLAFSRVADFSGMTADRLYVSAVKHKSFVEVNEQGTEAAAATTAVMSVTSVRQPATPFEMVVDRPFLFVIADHLTKALLFVGVVFEPASTG